jgi:hypothetical protein
MSRWQLYDPVADDTLTFRHNPKTMTSMAPGHATKAQAKSPIDGKIRALRAPDKPFTWSFSGRLRSKDEYDALLAWCQRPNRLQLTDHVGRVHELLAQRFAATPVEKSGGHNDWLFGYTIDTLYLRRVS